MNDDPEIPLLQDLLYKGQTSKEELEIEDDLASQSLDENSDIEIEPDTEFEQDDVEIKESSPEHEEHEQLPDEITDEEDKEQPTEKNQGTVENINPSTQQLLLEEEIRLILEKQMNKAHKKIMRLLKDRES